MSLNMTLIKIVFLLIYLFGCTANPSLKLNQQQKQINKPIKIVTNCTRETFQIRLDIGKPFKGIVFAKDFSEECRTRGNFSSSVELKIPTSGCGIRWNREVNEDSIELSVILMIQMDLKLRQSSDVFKIAKCIIPNDMMSMSLASDKENKKARNGRMRYEAPRVRVWLELGGVNGVDTVEVGESTTLGIRALLPGNIGVRVVDCSALDGLGEASQKLLDEKGCPIDEQVMPALLARYRHVESGWSKPHEDDLVEKLYTTTFLAFKFPDRERLHVQCGVQICEKNCPLVNCRSSDPFILDNEKLLARIEVYNSLAVKASNIDLDRLQTERHSNVSVDEVAIGARRIKSEGTLCLSMSKLALAFCVLGLIFLIAVIVSVCCLMRGRSRDKQLYGTNGTSIFSSSSSSQSQSQTHSRFGSKLLIPYGGSLPYGRVY